MLYTRVVTIVTQNCLVTGSIAKNVEFFCLFVCLSVCLFFTLLNVRDCAPDFAMKALEYRNNFDAIG